MSDENPMPDSRQPDPIGHEEEYDVPTPSERVIAVITNPREAFRDLRASRPWPIFLLCAVIIAVMNICAGLLLTNNETWRAYQKGLLEEKVDQIEEESSMSKKEKKEAIEMIRSMEGSGPLTTMMTVAGPIISTPVVLFLIAAILLIIMKVLERGEESSVRYTDALAVASLGGIITGLGTLLVAILSIVFKKPTFQAGASDLIDTESPYLTAVTAVLSVPTIWWIVVVGIGIAIVVRADLPKTWMFLGLTVLIIALVVGFFMSLFEGFA
jgi:hypothetical protein